MIEGVVTTILGPLAALGLIWALLSGRKLQKSALAYRFALSLAAAGLLVQLVIHFDADAYADWWLLKDMALIVLSAEVVRYQLQR